MLTAAAAMHDRFWGESVPSLAACGDRLVISGPATWERERDGHDLLPKQAPVAWDAFFGAVDDDVADAVRGLLADPAPLVERLTRRGTTLIHGDLRDDNLALADGRIVPARLGPRHGRHARPTSSPGTCSTTPGGSTRRATRSSPTGGPPRARASRTTTRR